MTEREIFEKYDKLSKNELNNKSNKRVCVKNMIMTTVIVRCRREKRRRHRKIDELINYSINDSNI